jgi:hypothetical protein
LELERGDRVEEVQQISSGTMDLFMEISDLCREADAFLAEKASVTSPLLKVQVFEKGMALADRLRLLAERLKGRQEELIVQTRYLNMAWETAPAVGAPTRVHVLPCSRLEQIYRDLSYLKRWIQQLGERLVQLSL